MMLESLTGIVYPSGAEVVFTYEPHDFHSRAQVSLTTESLNKLDNKMVGGLRIKKITTIDPSDGSRYFRTFSYDPDGTQDAFFSSGHLSEPPSIFRKMWFSHSPSHQAYFVGQNNMFAGVSRGPAVQYGYVLEELSSDSLSHGYIEYEYYNDATTPDSSFYTHYKSVAPRPAYRNYGNYPDWHSQISYMNLLSGKMKTKTVYDSEKKKLREESFSYEVKESGPRFSILKFRMDDLSSRGNLLVHTIRSYLNHYYEFQKVVLPVRQTILDIGDNDIAVREEKNIYYQSPYHHFPTKITGLDSKGTLYTERMIYAFDTSPNVHGNTVYGRMKSNYYNPLIASYKLRGDKLLHGEHFVYENLLPYQDRFMLKQHRVYEDVVLDSGKCSFDS